MTRASVVVVLLSPLACVTVGRQLYPGEPRPANEIAVVSEDPDSEPQIVRIDGSRVFGSEWEILPGNHELVVEATETAGADLPGTGQSQRMWFEARCKIAFRAVAGRTYVARSAGGYSGGPGFYSGNTSVWLADASKDGSTVGEPECELSVLEALRAKRRTPGDYRDDE